MKIAGVIVTYNRKKLLSENIKALLMQTKQLDAIIIIDNNSTDGTQEYIENMVSHFNNLCYVKLDINTGGAGGFYHGVKYAYENGYDFILLMDDDGKPYKKDTIELLLNRAIELYQKNQKLFVNSLVTYDGINTSFELKYNLNDINNARSNNDILLDDVAPFNCTLITKELVQEMGFPRADYFMSCDEREYLFRARKNGAFVATVPESIYQHPKAKDKVVKIFGSHHEIISSPKKEYYFVRNRMVTRGKMIYVIYYFAERMFTIIFLENSKKQRIINLIKATRDAIHKKMGERV